MAVSDKVCEHLIQYIGVGVVMLCLRDTLAVDLVEVGVKVVKDGVKACAFAVLT
jgi:hypothetical protein